ncbi:MAG: glucose-1-phosphate cytidylyltransferase [Pirellulales bacterium]
MKVVLFCGGMGMRMREYSESVPKPMVPIGYRPILWHLMKYYAYYGHRDFILCLGWQGDVIKKYFLNYNECQSNDFVLDQGRVDLLGSDIHDWRITFVDTGTHSNIGQRLQAVEKHLEGEEVFLANYADGLSDLHLPSLIDYFHKRDSIATCVGVKPRQSFHLVESDANGLTTSLTPVCDSDHWMNGGFFVLRSEIFDYMQPGEELVLEPFQRLIAQRKLSTYRYTGFWGCMDTYKEKQQLDELFASGQAPWKVWKQHLDEPDRAVQAPTLARAAK